MNSQQGPDAPTRREERSATRPRQKLKRAEVAAWLLALGLFTAAGSASAQEAAETGALREAPRFSVDLALANVGIDEFDINRLGVGFIPRWCPNRSWRWCWWIDIWWIPRPWPDPWQGVLPLREGPVLVRDLEVGPGLMVAPAIEYTFRAEERVRPSLYLGFGLQRDEGRTTDIAGVGGLSTSTTTSPVAIYGAGLTYDLSSRTSLRFTAGASTAFMDEMDIRGPGGQKFTVEGEELHSGIISVGLNVGLGGEGR